MVKNNYLLKWSNNIYSWDIIDRGFSFGIAIIWIIIMFRTMNYGSNFTRNYQIYPLISNTGIIFSSKDVFFLKFDPWDFKKCSNSIILLFIITRNLSFKYEIWFLLAWRRIQSDPSIVNTLKMIVSARASQIVVPNFSRNIAFIRMNPGKRKFGRKSSVPLLKFQIFTTIKRGFLGRGSVIAPFFGHNAVVNRPLSLPVSIPYDYLRSRADCTLHPIHSLRSLV